MSARLVLLMAAAGCASPDGRASDGQTQGGPVSVSSITDDTADTGSGTSPTTTGASMTGGPTTGATGATGEQTAGTTTGEQTSAASATTTDATTTDTTSADTDDSTGEPCVPQGVETCNGADDDCDGVVDDVDVGGDGICDCLNIALFGTKGSNPAAEFELWLEAQGTKVDRIQLDATPLTKAILDAYDIIIFDQLVRTYEPAEVALLMAWVETGGGLMTMTGHTGGLPDVERPNAVIGPMGLTYNNSVGIISGPVTSWNPHPVSMGITSVTFAGGFYIDIVEDGIGMNTIVATLPEGPVAVAQTRKAGKLFIWGDEWIEFDSEWMAMPEIPQLWANILGWLAPQNFCTVPL